VLQRLKGTMEEEQGTNNNNNNNNRSSRRIAARKDSIGSESTSSSSSSRRQQRAERSLPTKNNRKTKGALFPATGGNKKGGKKKTSAPKKPAAKKPAANKATGGKRKEAPQEAPITKKKTNFTDIEDKCITMAFVNVSEDPICGVNQTSATFWGKVKEQVEELYAKEERAIPGKVFHADSIMNRFQRYISR